MKSRIPSSLVLACLGLVPAVSADPLFVTGDPIRAIDTDITATSASNFPFNNLALRAVDGNLLTKYENFARANSGLIVTLPNLAAVVSSFTITTANDRPGNDPASYILYGTNDLVISPQNSTGTSETWVEIANGTLTLPTERLTVSVPVNVPGSTAYSAYKIIFPTLSNLPLAGTSLQIAEIQLYDAADGGGNPLLNAAVVPVAVQAPTAVTSTYPAGEPPSKAIDGLPLTPAGATSKYLNFGKFNTGFIITPALGTSVVQSFRITTGNDTEARDPASYQIFGTNDAITSPDNSPGAAENWTLIEEGVLTLPAARNTPGDLVVLASLPTSFTSYRVTFPRVKNPAATNSMQLSEIQFYTDSSGTLPIFAPADPIRAVALTASSSDTPSNGNNNESPVALLDGATGTKYLNFAKLETGFIVTPAGGSSTVQSFVLSTANDTPDRDPAAYALYGTNDPIASVSNSNGQGEAWTLISEGSLDLPVTRQTAAPAVGFANAVPYTSYRLTFPDVRNSVAANSMQVSEVQFFSSSDGTGTGLLTLTSPIIAVQLPHSASAYPGAEAPATILDNNTGTKYLNQGGANSGFIITPAGGPSIAAGFTISTANDIPGRDPVNWTLAGTNSPIRTPNNGAGDKEPWTEIANGTLTLPDARQAAGTPVTFPNTAVYTSYRFIATSLRDPLLPAVQYSEFQMDGVFAALPETFPITNVSYNAGTGSVSLTWASSPGETFRIAWSTDLSGWDDIVVDNINAADSGTVTTSTFANPSPGATRLFFQVQRL